MRLLTAAHAHARSVASGLSSYFIPVAQHLVPVPVQRKYSTSEDRLKPKVDRTISLQKSFPASIWGGDLTLFMIGRIASRFAPATDALAAASPGARCESGTRIGLWRCLTAFFLLRLPHR